jgi:hypothetical protein
VLAGIPDKLPEETTYYLACWFGAFPTRALEDKIKSQLFNYVGFSQHNNK